MATFTRDSTHVTRYWALHSAPHTDDLDTTTQKIRALLEDTVKRQLIADVPVVTMLSGGLDSSALTALAAREFRQEGKELRTYSIDFVDSAQNFSGQCDASKPGFALGAARLRAHWQQTPYSHGGYARVAREHALADAHARSAGRQVDRDVALPAV